MHAQVAQPHGWMQVLFPLAIFCVVMAIRAPRLMRLRPLNPDRLWMIPALYCGIVASIFVQRPPTLLGWGVAALGLVIGAALGWQRGKTMRIERDPATGQLMQKGSIWAIVFIAILFALKTISQAEGGAMHLDINLLIDGLAALSLGVFSAQRLEMYLRATRLLKAA
ncbi:DUF1453 domain-containing protein [Sphingomonas sp. MMS24-J45]|uniref:DUF1453 domain-containing protein n=1 Tax=Sphingomonas sp. MMS24-J45 TaxID=3238806 RepID=UPI00384CD7E2